MVTEDYVSFETAKLLKKKGFNEKAKSYFTDDGLEGYMFGTGQKSNSELEDCFYSRPTLQMAMKWLREIHNITIEPHYLYRKEWYAIVSSENPLGIGVYTTNTFNTYEEACEAGIRYSLENLI